MKWHFRAEEEPKDLQKVIVSDDNGSIGYGVWHNGRYGFGLAHLIHLKGTNINLYGFTRWISLDEMEEAL